METTSAAQFKLVIDQFVSEIMSLREATPTMVITIMDAQRQMSTKFGKFLEEHYVEKSANSDGSITGLAPGFWRLIA